MKVLIMFILNELLMEILGSVDTTFGNSIGIDSVCVLAAFTVIRWFFDKVTGLGKNSYYVALEDAKVCLLLNVFQE